jgi:hypothetical protein
MIILVMAFPRHSIFHFIFTRPNLYSVHPLIFSSICFSRFSRVIYSVRRSHMHFSLQIDKYFRVWSVHNFPIHNSPFPGNPKLFFSFLLFQFSALSSFVPNHVFGNFIIYNYFYSYINLYNGRRVMCRCATS